MNNIVLIFIFSVLFSRFSPEQITIHVAKNFIADTVPSLQNGIIKIKVFNNDTLKTKITMAGFGYDIYKNNVLFIHQPNVPAVAGNRGFSTAEKAHKAAGLVSYKIQNNIFPPAVSIQELDSLGVLR